MSKFCGDEEEAESQIKLIQHYLDKEIPDDDVDALQKHYREMQQNKQTKRDK